jgi:nucleoside-diphosphate-sugar epimerase
MDNSVVVQDCRRIHRTVDLSQLTGSSVLITGATGLIGMYILFTLRAFVEEGGKLEKLYLLSHRGLPKHLEEFNSYSWVEVLNGDLCDIDFCRSLPYCDYIIHAAGYGQPGKFLENQDKTLKLNTVTTFILLDHLKPQGHFLFISTSEVYSGNPRTPYKESDIGVTNTNHPRSCYIDGKRCGEAICNAYRAKGVDAKSARLCLAYGPGVAADDRRVLYNLISKGLSNGSIDLLDSGAAGRTYCYVRDAVELLLKILIYGKEDIYNVGGHSKTSVLQLAELIGDILKVKVNVPSENNTMNGAPLNVELDMSRSEAEFKKTEYVDLREGICRTIEWYRQYFDVN